MASRHSLSYPISFYKEKSIIRLINIQTSDLFQRLKKLDCSRLDISEYSAVYLKKHIDSLEYLFQMYTHIVYHLKKQTQKPFDQILVIDHGGGIGLLSLFCKSLGMQVIYNDVYKQVLDDAQLIAQFVDFKAEKYIHGDMDAIIDYCKKTACKADAIISSEVIEHIYDINAFIRKLPQIPSDQLSFVFSTSANTCNPIRKRKLVKLQKKAELHGNEYFTGHKDKDSLQSFVTIRKEIIKTQFPNLSQKEIDSLATATRGLKKEDIITSVEACIKTGKQPVTLAHKTNTCDPLTGNWVEHLLNPYTLAEQLEKLQCNTQVVNGYYGYNASENFLKKGVKKWVNQLIFLLKKRGIFLTHYWMLTGKYQSK